MENYTFISHVFITLSTQIHLVQVCLVPSTHRVCVQVGQKSVLNAGWWKHGSVDRCQIFLVWRTRAK